MGLLKLFRSSVLFPTDYEGLNLMEFTSCWILRIWKNINLHLLNSVTDLPNPLIVLTLTNCQNTKWYNAESDKWLNSRQLSNAPKVLEVWHTKRKLPGSHSMWEIASLITDFYGILPGSPIFPPKIVPWYIKACHLFKFLQVRSNALPFTFIVFYHAYAIPHPCSSILFLLGSSSFQFHS